jgi:hypothetical protein
MFLKEPHMTTAQVEKRLTALEQEVARLKAGRIPAAPPHPVDTLRMTHSTIENDEAFQEAMRLGKKWRRSLDAKPRRNAKAKSK